MTMGQMVFYSGAGLLALTVILAIVFLIKKPRYVPENAAVAESSRPAPPRGGYPSKPLTGRPAPAQTTMNAATEMISEPAGSGETAMMGSPETMLLDKPDESAPEQ